MNQNFNQIHAVFRNYLQEYLTVLKDKFKNHLLSVILFGSVARGQWNKESDIDLLLILADETPSTPELNQELTEITIDFETKNVLLDAKGNILYCPIKEVAFLVKELEHFRTLFYDISVDGIIIYDRFKVGKNFQEKIRNRITEKGLKRVDAGDNIFYWKHKAIKFGEIIEL